jgi:deoxyribonuclease V
MMDNKKWLSPETTADALAAQREMAERVVLQDSFQRPVAHVAGMDVSNTPFDPAQMIFASAVVLSFPLLSVVEIATQAERQEFPYIPGLLGFREVPALVHAYRHLSICPDLIMVDGHGVSHPRGLGVASHLGVLLDVPTIGVAKSILVGKAEAPLAEEAGSRVPLMWKGKEIGMLLRTKRRCSPLIISAGHKVCLETACELVLHCLRRYRLPETTRQAHLAANVCRKEFV